MRNFVGEVVDILNDNASPDLSFTCGVVLEELGSDAAISELVANGRIEENRKFCAIETKWRVLKDMLLRDASEKNLEIVIRAMEINPLMNFLDVFENNRSLAKDEHVKQKLSMVIEKIHNKNRFAS